MGMSELALILVLAALIFGPGQVPALMGRIGQGVKHFKEGQRAFDDAVRGVVPGQDDGEARRRAASDRGDGPGAVPPT